MFTYNEKAFEFVWMGLFTTDEIWIHPERREETYEIMYVVKGTVHIEEESEHHSLGKGELIILRPGVFHRGFLESEGETSFYWLHFRAENGLAENFPMKLASFGEGHLFKELLHFRNMPSYSEDLVNAVFLHLLFAVENEGRSGSGNALAEEICEWVRINADARLTVSGVAKHFGYNSEYVSRVAAKNCGMPLKKLIDRFKIERINYLLCNTHCYVKEISDIMKFSDPSALINFYKYHRKISPSEFRRLYTEMHMNKK